MRKFAIYAVAVVVVAATLTSFGESYHGLYLWAAAHGVTAPWSYIWPLMCDSFIFVAEASLFIAMKDGWDNRAKAWSWVTAITGLTVSVAANTGRADGAPWTTHLTYALPPVAAALCLLVGLGVLKQISAHSRPAVAARVKVKPAEPAPAKPAKPVQTAELGKKEKVAQMVKLTPNVSVNALAQHAGVSWTTAKKWREEFV